jgi:hypothetical protein
MLEGHVRDTEREYNTLDTYKGTPRSTSVRYSAPICGSAGRVGGTPVFRALGARLL